MSPTKAVFLDRDGVINSAIVESGKPYPPRSLEQLELEQDVAETLVGLRDRGYLLFVITNQPDVARGMQTREKVDEMHGYLRRTLPLTDVYVCYHDDADGCDCRKPRPGMIYRARDRYGLDLATCWVVGDRWRDIEAGKAAGCRTIHVARDYAERRPSCPDHTVNRVSELLAWIV